MSSYRDAFFYGRDAISKLGLAPAPKREKPSHEMQAAIELDRQEVEHARAIDRRIADELRQTWHKRSVDKLRPLVEEYGPEAVVKISRRVDPKFELPAELLAEKDEER